MPKRVEEKITANLEFLAGDTVVLQIRDQKFSPLEYQYLLTQAEGLKIRVSTNGHQVSATEVFDYSA